MYGSFLKSASVIEALGKGKGTWQLNAKHDSSLNPELQKASVKNMIGTSGDSVYKKKMLVSKLFLECDNDTIIYRRMSQFFDVFIDKMLWGLQFDFQKILQRKNCIETAIQQTW